MGEQGILHLLTGEDGGRIAAFLRSLGVTGDLRVVLCRGERGTAKGEDLRAKGDGNCTDRGEYIGLGECKGWECTGFGLINECIGLGLDASCSAESE